MAENLLERLINREAEMALIGSILIDPGTLDKLDVDPTDFYLVSCREIWNSFRILEHTGKEIDYLTVTDHLSASGKLEDIGGASYLTRSIAMVPTSMNAQYYAGIVRELSSRRLVLRAANELANQAIDRQQPIDSTISDFAIRIPQLVRLEGGAQHMSVYAERHHARVEKMSKNPELRASYKTGYLDFDRITGGGLKPGELMLLLGKPGLGKTIWLLQMAVQMGANHTPGAVYEMETAEEAVLDREISRQSKISVAKLETGALKEDDWDAYIRTIEKLSDPELGVYIDFNPVWTSASIRADLTRLKARYGIKWFAVDYLKFLNDLYGVSETERQNHISMALKRICRELNLAGVVIHSLNKNGLNSQAPNLGDMSQGADIAFDCDKVLFLVEHTPEGTEKVNENMRTFYFGKSRSQINGKIFHMLKQYSYPAFSDIVKDTREKRS
jgi:replicative DNA helicase